MQKFSITGYYDTFVIVIVFMLIVYFVRMIIIIITINNDYYFYDYYYCYYYYLLLLLNMSYHVNRPLPAVSRNKANAADNNNVSFDDRPLPAQGKKSGMVNADSIVNHADPFNTSSGLNSMNNTLNNNNNINNNNNNNNNIFNDNNNNNDNQDYESFDNRPLPTFGKKANVKKDIDVNMANPFGSAVALPAKGRNNAQSHGLLLL